MTDYSGTTVEERAAMEALFAMADDLGEKADSSFGSKKEIYEKIFGYIGKMIEEIIEDNPHLDTRREWE